MRVLRVRVAAIALVLVVAGCASIPVEGPVRAGSGNVPFNEDLIPISLQIPENDPVRLVMGFIAASASGVVGDFSEERTFLFDQAQTEWDPFASVTVYGSGDLTPTWDENTATVSVSLPLVATVDRAGRMTEYKAGTRTTVTYEAIEILPGRWRISSLDDGIILSEASFSLVFRPVDLAFASSDAVLVPDLRWFPKRNTATHATLALIGGPAPWMEDAVVTGFQPTAALDVKAVPVAKGIAEVALSDGSTGGVAERSLAFGQIVSTLTALPDVVEVRVSVGGLEIGKREGLVLSGAPIPSTRAATISSGRLGIWEGEALSLIRGGGRLPSGARDISLSYDGRMVALVVGEGRLVVAAVPDGLVPSAAAGLASTDLELDPVYEGNLLVSPSFDRLGWLWTAEAEGEGVLHAISPGGEHSGLRIPGMEGRDIGGIAVSHDGVRIVLLSEEGGVWRLGIAGIVRNADGAPLSVGTPQDLGVGIGPSEALTWVDERVVAVLGSSRGEEVSSIRLVTVGGRTEVIEAVPGAIDLTARNGIGSLVLVTSDGAIHVRVGAQWSLVDLGLAVSSLAFSG